MILLLVFGIFIAIVSVGTAKVVAGHWNSLSETDAVPMHARLSGWFIKGVVAPIIIWIFFVYSVNGGRFPRVPRFLAQVLSISDWIAIVLRSLLPALIVVGSYWAAMTAVWLVVHLVVTTESRRVIRGTSLFWGLILSPVIALILFMCGWWGLGFALLLPLIPIARELMAFGPPKPLEPVYSRAVDEIKRGQPTKAEQEVLRQLERKEDDYDGWMMLAELYATKFNDIAGAERTIREIAQHPKTTKDQYCRALHRLADWHLNVAKDAEAARRTLEQICTAYPHSIACDAARKHMDQLPVARIKL